MTLEVALSPPCPASKFSVQDAARQLVLDRCLMSEQLWLLVTLYLKLLSSHQNPDLFALDRLKFRAAAVPTSRGHRFYRLCCEQ